MIFLGMGSSSDELDEEPSECTISFLRRRGYSVLISSFFSSLTYLKSVTCFSYAAAKSPIDCPKSIYSFNSSSAAVLFFCNFDFESSSSSSSSTISFLFFLEDLLGTG